MTNLAKILTYPEIRRAFDLAVARHGDSVRKWFGKLLKVVMPNKPDGLGPIDIKTMKWVLIRLSKRSFKKEDDLYAAGFALYIELYEQHWRESFKRETKDRMSHVSESLERWR